MRIGYVRISEEDQSLPVQRQALLAVGGGQVYEKRACGQTTRRPQRDACLRALHAGNTLVVWRLDGRPRKLQPHELQAVRALRAAGQVPVKAIAARFGVAPSTVYCNLTATAGPDGSSESPPAAYA